MKRLILCVVLFIAVCALTAGSYFYIVNTTAKLLNKVELVAELFESGDFVGANEAAGHARELWLRFNRRRHLIIDRGSIEDITISLERIKLFSYERDGELHTECRVAVALLEQYMDKQRLNLYNIL